ncbi:hypothetical protein [Halpernia sp. GG3]
MLQPPRQQFGVMYEPDTFKGNLGQTANNGSMLTEPTKFLLECKKQISST